ncbi:hypothetical protein PENTCL1PPCAC_21973, partial [Pristionchus entomophagus]
NNKTRVFFFIGSGDAISDDLQQEIENHNDIIIIDVEDVYRNLVYKTAAMLFISTKLCSSSFVMKVDEDVLFNIDRLYEKVVLKLYIIQSVA